MNHADCTQQRVKLDADSYSQLHRQILQRDGWRCQFCGGMQQLEVHHLKFRSHSGEDAEHNLITLCTSCHARVHLLQSERTP